MLKRKVPGTVIRRSLGLHLRGHSNHLNIDQWIDAPTKTDPRDSTITQTHPDFSTASRLRARLVELHGGRVRTTLRHLNSSMLDRLNMRSFHGDIRRSKQTSRAHPPDYLI